MMSGLPSRLINQRAAAPWITLYRKATLITVDSLSNRLEPAQQAFAWYEKAAAQGLAEAQFNLGLMYYSGDAVTEDVVLDCAWINLAAAGNERARMRRDLQKNLMSQKDLAEAQQRSPAVGEVRFLLGLFTISFYSR